MRITERRLRSLIREEAQVILEGKRDFIRPELPDPKGKIIKNPTRELLASELFPHLWAPGSSQRDREFMRDDERFHPQNLELFYDSIKRSFGDELKNFREIEVFPFRTDEGMPAAFRWYRANSAPLSPTRIHIGDSLPPVAYQWEAELVRSRYTGQTVTYSPHWEWKFNIVDSSSYDLDQTFTDWTSRNLNNPGPGHFAPVTRKEIEEAYDLMLDNPEHRERGIFSRIIGTPLNTKQVNAMQERIWKIANEFARKHGAPVRKIRGL